MESTISRCDVILGVLGLGQLVAGLTALFALKLCPTTMLPFDLNDETINYPILEEQVNGMGNLAAGGILSLTMMCIWLVIEFKAGRTTSAVLKRKLVLSVFCIIYGGSLVNLLTHVIKQYRGSLRPNFLAACQLNQTLVSEIRNSGRSWVDLETTKVICTSEDRLTYRWSFPSGHSSTVSEAGLCRVACRVAFRVGSRILWNTCVIIMLNWGKRRDIKR